MYLRENSHVLHEKEGHRYFDLDHAAEAKELTRFIRVCVESWRGNMKHLVCDYILVLSPCVA
jgi:hypothetical protein